MATFTPTSEQRAIVDAFATGDDLIVVAGAGAGKTATLMLMAEATPERRGVYVAYNKALADEAAARFKKAGLNVECRTAHSLAYARVGHQYRHRLNGPRISVQDKAAMLGLRGRLPVSGDISLGLFPQVQLVSRTVETFMKTMDKKVTAEHIPPVPTLTDRFRPRFEDTIVRAAQSMWDDLQDVNGRHYFSHDAYLAMWARSNPVLDADYVMLDESQDASPEIAHVVTSQEMQKVAVGDPNQTLYAWRGARDAMEGMPENTTRLTLSQSFRFGDAIADEANEWLTDLGSDLRITGTSSIASRVSDPLPLSGADASLHRTNAGAMTTVINAVTSGLAVAVVGGGKDLRALALAAQDLQTKGRTTHPELTGFATWKDVVDYADTDDGADLKPMVGLVAAHTPAGIVRAIDSCVTEDKADLVVSTAHKAKGRQWSRVRIGEDFKAPDSEKITRAEQMLSYVAVTRAQHVLDPGSLTRTPTGAGYFAPDPGETAPDADVITIAELDTGRPATVTPEPADVPDQADGPDQTGGGSAAAAVDVTVRFEGEDAEHLRAVLGRLGYKSPDAFVTEMAKTHPFFLEQVDAVKAEARTERLQALGMRRVS